MKKIIILLTLFLLIIVAVFLYIKSTSDVEIENEGEEESLDVLRDVLLRAKEIEYISYTATLESESDERIFEFSQNKERILINEGINEDRLSAYINTDTEEYFGYFDELGVVVPLESSYLLQVAEISVITLAEYLLQEEAQVVDREVIDGDNFLVIEHTDILGRSMTFWVWEEYGIPVMVEIYLEEQGFSMINFSEISFDSISEDVFLIPEETVMENL